MSDHADTIRRYLQTRSIYAGEPSVGETLAALDALLAERQQAIDALREAEHQCREHIRRAAFSAPIGARYSEKLRLGIADECRRLEDGIRAALVELGEKP